MNSLNSPATLPRNASLSKKLAILFFGTLAADFILWGATPGNFPRAFLCIADRRDSVCRQIAMSDASKTSNTFGDRD